MYRFITFRGVIDKQARKIWKNKMPMKLRVFVWQSFTQQVTNWGGFEKDEMEGQ
jgi:hypothetical protein